MYMVSMCCEDCKAEKLKSNVLSKILLNEHCKNISEYLGCDDCIKMNAILNDPIYKTLDPEQQQIFKVVKLFPFPKTIKELKQIFSHYIFYGHTLVSNTDKSKLPVLKKLLNKTTFSIIKNYYNNMYINDLYKNDFIRNKETIKQELEKNTIFWSPRYCLLSFIELFLTYYELNKPTKYFEFCSLCYCDFYRFICTIKKRTKTTTRIS